MDVYIIGCGGNSKIVIDICECLGYNIIGIFDDKYNGSIVKIYKKYNLIGNIENINYYQNINIINSIGDNNVRKNIFEKFCENNLCWINCIHPESRISDSVTIGKGNIICRGAIINADASIGDFNLINTCAIIEHDCKIMNFNHFAPKSTLCGAILIGNLNLFGAGSTIIPCKKIGNNNIIGAMSVIIRNIDNNVMVVGNPGKIIKIIK